MSTLLVPDRLITPGGLVEGAGVLIDGPRIADVGPTDALRDRADTVVELAGLTLAPGLVDLQVNGGGGVLFNDEPSTEGLLRISQAHLICGTTTLLPTVISTDHPTMDRAMSAVEAAIGSGMAGVVGVHFEGPFLDEDKRGAHESRHLRAPTPEDVELLLRLGSAGKLLVTLSATHAGESFTTTLLDAGALLSLGHTQATAEEARRAFDHGVGLVTHLYNAMSPMEHRAPGVVGAALADDRVTVGVIADGHHVDPLALRAAWKAKGPEQLLCVSDAIAVAGTDQTESVLAGQRVRVEGGRCVNEEGVLAGSAIALADSLPILVHQVGLDLAEAVTACATTPARALGLADRGVVEVGLQADLIALDGTLKVRGVWQEGNPIVRPH